MSTHLGKPKHIFVNRFPLNENGLPVIPHVEIADVTLTQLATLLDEYILSLWSRLSFVCCILHCFNLSTVFAHPNNPSIPWDEIRDTPNEFFDADLFKLPTPLGPIDDWKSSPLKVYGLLDYFTSISSSTPFSFYPERNRSICDGNEPDMVGTPTLNPNLSPVVPPQTTTCDGDESDVDTVLPRLPVANPSPLPPVPPRPKPCIRRPIVIDESDVEQEASIAGLDQQRPQPLTKPATPDLGQQIVAATLANLASDAAAADSDQHNGSTSTSLTSNAAITNLDQETMTAEIVPPTLTKSDVPNTVVASIDERVVKPKPKARKGSWMGSNNPHAGSSKSNSTLATRGSKRLQNATNAATTLKRQKPDSAVVDGVSNPKKRRKVYVKCSHI